jgi:hypothetical protein
VGIATDVGIPRRQIKLGQDFGDQALVVQDAAIGEQSESLLPGVVRNSSSWVFLPAAVSAIRRRL